MPILPNPVETQNLQLLPSLRSKPSKPRGISPNTEHCNLDSDIWFQLSRLGFVFKGTVRHSDFRRHHPAFVQEDGGLPFPGIRARCTKLAISHKEGSTVFYSSNASFFKSLCLFWKVFRTWGTPAAHFPWLLYKHLGEPDGGTSPTSLERPPYRQPAPRGAPGRCSFPVLLFFFNIFF